MNTSQLSALLVQWEEGFEKGLDLPADRLCPDDPDLAAELGRRIQLIRQMRRLQGEGSSSETCASIPPTIAPPVDRTEEAAVTDTVAPSPGGDSSATATTDWVRQIEEAHRPPVLPGYQILGELGRGGMGVVYKARQTGLNRIVALKMILAGSHAGPEERVRFLGEAESIAAIRHPGIVQIHDIGTHEGLPFFSLEFCPGGSLAGKLAGNSLPPRDASAIVEQVARAVQAAHAEGVVHRDLKPGNVLLTADGTPKVTDFGLARRVQVGEGLTLPGAVVGTPSYMSPEQAEGRSEVGPETDVYALGAILYECLTGRPPFKAASPYETVRQVINEEPVAPHVLNAKVPRDLETIALKCLAKEPGQRYPTAAAFADDLARWRAGEPITARRAGVAERAVKWARRRPALAALAASLLLAALAAVFGSVSFGLYQEQSARGLKAQLARRGQVESFWSEGRDAEAAGNLEAARGAFERALAVLDADPSDDPFRDEINARLDRVRARLRDRADLDARRRKQEQDRKRTVERLDRLDRDRDQLLFLSLSVQDSDEAGNRAAIRKRTPAALAALGVRDTGPPAAPDLPEATAAERQKAAAWCRELLLVWADAEAADPERALDLVGRAEALGKAAGLPPAKALLLRRARYLAARGEQGAAKEAADEAAKCPPTTALDHFLLALEDYLQGKPASAVRACERALEREPDNFWAQYLQGLGHLRQARWAEASAWLTVCVNRRPDFFWPRVQRGAARVEAGDLGGARADLDLALKRADDRLEKYAVRVARSRLAGVERRWEEARDELIEAVAVQPAGAFEAHANLAEVLRRLGELPEARAEIDRAVAARPTEGRLYYARARLHAENNDPAAAAADFTEAVKRGSESSGARWLAAARVELGHLAHEAREYDDALGHFAAALRVVEDYPEAHRQRALTLLAQGRHAEAGKALDAYRLRSKPDFAVEKARGLIHATRKEYAQAIEVYTAALRLKRDNDTLSFRGYAYLQTQSVKLALADFESVLKADPRHGDSLAGRGQARALLGETAAAVADAEASLKHGKPTPTLFLNAACIHARAAAREERIAERSQERAVALVGAALKLVRSEQRAAFWKQRVEKEPALKPLLRLEGMKRLERGTHP